MVVEEAFEEARVRGKGVGVWEVGTGAGGGFEVGWGGAGGWGGAEGEGGWGGVGGCWFLGRGC